VAIEFVVQIGEFAKAVRFLLAGRPRTKKAQSEFVDMNVANGELELVTTGASSALPAEVVRSGYGRAPYLVFEWFGKAVKTLKQPSVRVLIEPGKVKAANLIFSHADISVRLIGARIADLPMDAPLPDVLALQARFSDDELEDSGLLAKVMAAQEQASGLIDKAMKALEPLEVDREALGRFIWEQIKRRSQNQG